MPVVRVYIAGNSCKILRLFVLNKRADGVIRSTANKKIKQVVTAITLFHRFFAGTVNLHRFVVQNNFFIILHYIF